MYCTCSSRIRRVHAMVGIGGKLIACLRPYQWWNDGSTSLHSGSSFPLHRRRPRCLYPTVIRRSVWPLHTKRAYLHRRIVIVFELRKNCRTVFMFRFSATELVPFPNSRSEGAPACVLGTSYAAMPKIVWMNWRCATASPCATQPTLTFADCMHRLVTLRSFGKHPPPIGIRGSP